MKLGEAHVIQGNALNLPLPDNSVDACITSPPYFGLRSYQDGGKHYDGQIGSEATPTEFLDALLAATREMVRVLKPTGSIFVNLGDKYAGSSIDNRERPPGARLNNPRNSSMRSDGVIRAPKTDVRPKSLMGIPWRYAIACIDQLGLILRAEIIWSKPNGLPESVTDRVRRSHEQWFHFVKQPRYFAAVDELREEHLSVRPGTKSTGGTGYEPAMSGRMNGSAHELGKLPGSVWTIPTQPLTVPPELGVDHFAAYPMEWPRRIIQGWTPNGVCTACGQGRRPCVAKDRVRDVGYDKIRGVNDGSIIAMSGGANFAQRAETTATITGYACGCPPNTRTPTGGEGPKRESLSTPTAPTIPAVVLDPFGGTGTTALVAKALGRTGISVDLSHDYCRMAVWRTNDPGELASALQVEKPEPVPDGQVALF